MYVLYVQVSSVACGAPVAAAARRLSTCTFMSFLMLDAGRTLGVPRSYMLHFSGESVGLLACAGCIPYFVRVVLFDV